MVATSAGLRRQRVSAMDLRQIEYFVALYDERSITKAARRLNVVQPAVSMQISRIERSFKTKLFHRTSRGVLPTDTGRTFYGLCQKILNEVYEAQRYLRDTSGNVAGHLTIGVMPSVANSVLPAVLVGYKSSYPDVTLRIVEAYSGSLLDQLHAGNLDLAIVNNSGPLSNTAILPLFRDYLIFATRYQAGKRFAHTIESHRLSDFRLVLPSQRQGMRGLIDSILAAKGIALQPEIELDSLGPTIELVAKSDWGTILPIIAVTQALDRKLLRAQRIIDPAIPREVIAVSPLTRTPTLAAELFLKSLKAMSLHCLSELPDPFLQADQF